MESLLLFRRALSSPTMCRFIPALSGPFNFSDGVAIRLLATVALIYSLSVAPGTQTLLGARSLVLGWVSTLTYWSPPLFLGTARKTR